MKKKKRFQTWSQTHWHLKMIIIYSSIKFNNYLFFVQSKPDSLQWNLVRYCFIIACKRVKLSQVCREKKSIQVIVESVRPKKKKNHLSNLILRWSWIMKFKDIHPLKCTKAPGGEGEIETNIQNLICNLKILNKLAPRKKIYIILFWRRTAIHSAVEYARTVNSSFDFFLTSSASLFFSYLQHFTNVSATIFLCFLYFTSVFFFLLSKQTKR